MNKFDELTTLYLEKGVSVENIEYAIASVKSQINRDHIMEGLMEDYRGLSLENAHDLVDDLYEASGNEFRNYNITGFVLGFISLFIGIASS